MSYTGLVEAAVCGPKDKVRFIQNEFNKHVKEIIWFACERAINNRKPKQHIPWDNDNDTIHEGSWTVMHLIRRNYQI